MIPLVPLLIDLPCDKSDYEEVKIEKTNYILQEILSENLSK